MRSHINPNVFFKFCEDIDNIVKKQNHTGPEDVQDEIVSQLCAELDERVKQLESIQPSKEAQILDAHIARVIQEAKQKELEEKILRERLKELEQKQEVLMPSTLFPNDDLEDTIANKDEWDEEIYAQFKL